MRYVQEQQMALDTPWLPIKLSAISEGLTVPLAFQEVMKDRMEIINICRLSLVRKRQHLVSEEFVPRPGLLASTAPIVKCIFGFSMFGDGCVEKVLYNCEDCGAFCCELHRPHTTHKAEVEATPNLVLQQQISASATSNNSSAVATSILPEINRGTKKTPGKNTKEDLKQRYLTVTGRQTLDSKYSSLRVADLRVIVENLERGIAPGAFPAPGGSSANRRAFAGSQAQILASTPTVVGPPMQLAAPPIPVSLSATDQVMSTFVLTMLQSNPALRDQLLLSMQESVASLSKDNSSLQVGGNSLEGGGNECGSDDDNPFE